MTSAFWGLRMEPGKRYSTTVDKSFHVSMAALDCSTVKNDKEVLSVMMEEGESNIPFILCNLQKPKVIQSNLNLTFVSGDRVTFFCRGSGTVHLTGYLILEDDEDFPLYDDAEDLEDEADEEEDDVDDDDDEEVEESVKDMEKQNGLKGKRKGEILTKSDKKKAKLVAESTDNEDTDETEDDDLEGVENEESSDEEENEDSEEVISKEVVKEKSQKLLQKNSKKQKKQNQLSPAQQGKQKQQNQNGGTPQSSVQQKKKQSNEEKKTPEAATVATKKVLEGGVVVKDLKVGNGPICKSGRMVSVFYTGRLKSNNKVFDSSTQGAGFKFRVGKGEVIKGWDVGVAGMKVGGKRLITCPPNMGYGPKGAPPTIPGNSTLLFEVELKSVN